MPTNSAEHVIAFKECTLQKCQQVQIVRAGTKSKYSSIEIPAELDAVSGYHANCYKTYTAISLPKILEEETPVACNQDATEESIPPKRQLRSDNSFKTSNPRTGVLEEKCCLFCDKKHRKNKGHKEKLCLCQTKNIEIGIREDAAKVKDLVKISTLDDFVAKEVRYHQLCRIEFSNRAKATEKSLPKNDEWHQSRKAHNKAFESLSFFLDEIIIKKEEVHLLEDLHQIYMSAYEEAYDGIVETSGHYTAYYLAEKIASHYTDKIKIENIFGSKKLVFSAKLSSEQATLKATDPVPSPFKQIRAAALLLRKEILNLVKRPLPERLTLKDIFEGEIQVPKLLSSFFQYLVGGER